MAGLLDRFESVTHL